MSYAATQTMDRTTTSVCDDYIQLPDIENQWDAYEASKQQLLNGGLNEGKYALYVNKRMFEFKIFDTLSQAYKYVSANAKRGYDNCLLQRISSSELP